MDNSIFIRILKTFSKAEFKEFDKFVHSPYFNTSEATTKLFECIAGFYPGFDDPLFFKEAIFKIIHPGKKYDDILMRKYISNLNKLTEEFLVVNNNRFPAHSLLTGLLNKELYDLFLLRSKKIEQGFAENKIDDEYFLHRSLVKGEEVDFCIRTDRVFEFETAKMSLLELDTFYYFYRLAQVYHKKHGVAADEDKNITRYLVSGIDLKVLYNRIESSEIKNKPILKFLISLPLLQQTHEEALYKEIKEFTFSYTKEYSSKTFFIGYLYLLDFITYKIEQGNTEYYKERYLIYKFNEEAHYVRSSKVNTITFVPLNNYFNAALRNNDIKWARQLIERYIDSFEQKGEKRLRSFFEASILFHERKFSEALAALAYFSSGSHHLDDYLLTRDMRTLFLQIYFELGYIDEAFYSIDSFYHYLNNSKKINQKNRTYFGNFVRLYKEIIIMVSKDDYSNLKNVRENIISSKTIKKTWLIDKLNGLDKRNSNTK